MSEWGRNHRIFHFGNYQLCIPSAGSTAHLPSSWLRFSEQSVSVCLPELWLSILQLWHSGLSWFCEKEGEWEIFHFQKQNDNVTTKSLTALCSWVFTTYLISQPSTVISGDNQVVQVKVGKSVSKPHRQTVHHILLKFGILLSLNKSNP